MQIKCSELSRTEKSCWAFSGGPEVKMLSFQCRECGFDPWLGNLLRSHILCSVAKKGGKKSAANNLEFNH